MVYKDTSVIYQKRLPVSINYGKGIVDYDVDNLYPQRVDSITRRSPIALSCIETISDFLNGDGFQLNWNEVFNFDEININGQLFQVSVDFAQYQGFAFHLNVNIFGFITEFSPVEFDKLRLGTPDKHNRHKTIAFSEDWSSNSIKPSRFPIWPGDVKRAREIVLHWKEGFENFPGFVLYWTPKKNSYPYATLDSALDSAQTSGEIQVFELANIQNGFLSATLLKHPGEFLNDTKREEFIRNVTAIKGPGNANSVVVMETPEGLENDKVLEQFPANNNDKLFELTDKNVTNRIVQRSRMPPILLGVFPDGGGFFNEQQLKDAYSCANIVTQTRRSILADVFNDIGSNMMNPIQFGEIIKQTFGEVTPQQNGSPNNNA